MLVRVFESACAGSGLCIIVLQAQNSIHLVMGVGVDSQREEVEV